MRIIDFHTHIYPEKIAEKATANTCEFYGLNTDLVGTASVLLEEGTKAGITDYVLLPVVIKPEQTRHINDFIIGEVKNHTEFHGYGALHAAMDKPLDEIDYIIKAGLKGIKLHPDIQGFPADDPRLFPIYGRLQDKLPVLIHCGDPRSDYSHPRRLRHVIDSFPHLQIIAAHLGGWSMFDSAVEYLKYTSCCFDLSSCFQYLSTGQMRAYIDIYGAERILFGSDFPLWNPKKEMETFLGLGLTESEQDKILSENAARLLFEI